MSETKYDYSLEKSPWDEQNTEDAAGQPNPNKNKNGDKTEDKNGETGAKVGAALNAAAKVVGQFTQKEDWSRLNR